MNVIKDIIGSSKSLLGRKKTLSLDEIRKTAETHAPTPSREDAQRAMRMANGQTSKLIRNNGRTQVALRVSQQRAERSNQAAKGISAEIIRKALGTRARTSNTTAEHQMRTIDRTFFTSEKA